MGVLHSLAMSDNTVSVNLRNVYYNTSDVIVRETLVRRIAAEAIKPYIEYARVAAERAIDSPTSFQTTTIGGKRRVSFDEFENGIKLLGAMVFAELRDEAFKDSDSP